jgi:hypothetical protein
MNSYGSKYGPLAGCFKYSEVILSLFNISRREDAWGIGGPSPPFLASSLGGGEWSAHENLLQRR